jgi:hypothetical protein
MSDLRTGASVQRFQTSQFLGYEPNSTMRTKVDLAQVVSITSRLFRENWPIILFISLMFSFLPQAILPLIGSLEDMRAGVWFQPKEDTSSDLDWFDFVAGTFSSLSCGYITLLVLSKNDHREVDFVAYIRASWPIFLISVIYILGILLGLILLVVPGVLIALAWSVALPALVHEKLGVVNSIGRSSELTIGNRWQILLILAGIVVLSFLLGLFGEFVGSFISDLLPLPKSSEVFVSLMNVIGEVVSTVIIAALYLQLRACKEGPQVTQVADVFE